MSIHMSFLPRILLWLPILILLVSTLVGGESCSDNFLMVSGTPDYTALFRGHWTARAGDINIRTGLGFVKYNWYIINPPSSRDSVKVTWDDGSSCTTSKGILSADTISLEVYFIQATFRMLADTTIQATFRQSDTKFFKRLYKDSNDTTFYCI